MATRKILCCGDPVLRRRARRVKSIDEELIELLREMKEMMLQAYGLGLAAPQVGELTAAVIVRPDPEEDDTIELINPRIVEREGEEEGLEGCLSLPTLRGMVIRPARVVVEALSEDGQEIVIQGEGMLARAVAHEVDHLFGRLFIDEVELDSLTWMRPDEDEESGYRLEPTTLEEALAAFERLRKRRGDE